MVTIIETAKTNHVIYFLLATYVETLRSYNFSGPDFPAQITNLPFRGRADVKVRLRVLHDLVENSTDLARDMRRVVKEAVKVFATAAIRLSALEHYASVCGDHTLAGNGRPGQ